MKDNNYEKKIALVDPTEKAIGWISKYGSMTFN